MISIKLPGYRDQGLITLANIVYLKGSSNYTVFYLASGEELMVSQTLKVYADLPGFLRISKGSMVNSQAIQYVSRIDSKTAFVVTNRGLRLLISRRRILAVTEAVNANRLRTPTQ